jgi:chemotaxis protein methyltransferase CheR
VKSTVARASARDREAKRSEAIAPGWTTATLDSLISTIRLTHDRDLSRLDESFLARSLERRLEATATASPETYLARLAKDPPEADALLQSLDIHHSELFRDPLACALLEQRILPGLALQKEAQGGTEIRVWSAGCAAGQEAYTVAILLSELSDARELPVPFRIIATDGSEAQLDLAREAAYAGAAMRQVRLGHLERWFTRSGQTYTARPELRARVDFSAYDLLDGRSTSPPASIFGEFDLVLCCNLLYYYRPDARRLILDKLRGCLSPNGVLVTGETEREAVLGMGGFRAVAASAAVFQKGR